MPSSSSSSSWCSFSLSFSTSSIFAIIVTLISLHVAWLFFHVLSFCFHFVSFHLDLYLPPRSRSRNLGCQIDGERNSVHDSVRRPMVLFEFVFFGSSPRFSQLALLYLPVLRIQVPQQILSFAGISWWCYIEFEQTTKICLPCLPCEKFNSHIFSPFFPWNGYNPIPLLLNTPIASQKNVEIPIHHGFVARGCYFLNGGGRDSLGSFFQTQNPRIPKNCSWHSSVPAPRRCSPWL